MHTPNNTVSNSFFVTNPVGNGASGVSTFGNTQVGWTAGGGVEWSPLTFPAWSAKVEYLYTDLGSVRQGDYSTYSSDPIYGFGASRTSQMQFNTVRVGLNWHFNPFVGTKKTLRFLREQIPKNWSRFSDSVTDNFRVISPRDFRVMT